MTDDDGEEGMTRIDIGPELKRVAYAAHEAAMRAIDETEDPRVVAMTLLTLLTLTYHDRSGAPVEVVVEAIRRNAEATLAKARQRSES